MPDNNLRPDTSNQKDDESKRDENHIEQGSLRWMGYGIEFVGVMGIFTFAGYWADQKLETKPWLMITGLLIAFTGMIYLLIKETAYWRK